MPLQRPRPEGPPIASDAVRQYARTVGVDLDSVGLVTGANGEITQWDVELQRVAAIQAADAQF